MPNLLINGTSSIKLIAGGKINGGKSKFVVRFTLDSEITSFGAKAKCYIKPETT